MCNKVCHIVAENALTVNCSLIFKHKHECSGHVCGVFYKSSEGSNTHKFITLFALTVIVSIFVKLFMILYLHLRQLFIILIFVKRAEVVTVRPFRSISSTKKKGLTSRTLSAIYVIWTNLRTIKYGGKKQAWVGPFSDCHEKKGGGDNK